MEDLDADDVQNMIGLRRLTRQYVFRLSCRAIFSTAKGL